MKVKPLQTLFEKYLQNNLSKTEAEALEGAINDPSSEAPLKQSISAAFHHPEQNGVSDTVVEEITGTLEKKVFGRIHLGEKNVMIIKPNYWRYAVAAVILVCTVGLVLYTFHKKSESTAIATSGYDSRKDIAPGTSRATLTLNNGKTIVLSEKMEGIRVKDGHIHYENGDMLVNQTSSQITMTVPRGGKYKLQLSDGTRVWLNAATSLTYPTNFSGPERVVEVNGEAYFEVQHDKDHPFLVKSGMQTVRVLGTAFNINTYQGEKAITTLVNGQIALRPAKGDEKILTPGDQAITNGHELTLSKVLTQDYIAWKDDLIVLNNQDLNDIFKQLERWYDVEFINTDLTRTRKTLSGEIPRNTNLSAILQALEEQAHVKFEIKGRRIMIRN